MVYDCLDEDPLVSTPHELRLADSIIMQPYGIAKNVLIEFQDSLTLNGRSKMKWRMKVEVEWRSSRAL
jgi:hypothetical protein